MNSCEKQQNYYVTSTSRILQTLYMGKGKIMSKMFRTHQNTIGNLNLIQLTGLAAVVITQGLASLTDM